MENKIVISGYYGFENFGDEAILKVLVENLKDKKFDVTVFSKNPKSTTEKLNVKSIYTFSVLKIFNAIRKTDFLISGGGSLLQDVTSWKSLLYYLFVINLALFLRKKVIIFAQGIGPINSKILSFLTKQSLKKCHYITVRDDKSLFLLRGWGLKPELVNDPVWALVTPQRLPENKIGIQLRRWHTLDDDFLYELANQTVTNYPDKEISLFAFQNSLDLPICEKFAEMIKKINPFIKISIIKNENISEILNEMAKCELFIAMRFHAILVALKMNIPSIAICYDVKVENIAQEAAIPTLSINKSEQITACFKQISILENKLFSKKFDFSNIFEHLRN